MSLFVMDMPETHAELVEWIEQHLVGLNLASLVAELTAIHGQASDGSTLNDLLGDRKLDVIKNGLTVLDTKQVRSLLCHPRRLLDLQGLVLSAGKQHWRKRMTDTADDHFERIAETGWKRVKLAIAPPVDAFAGNGFASAGSLETVTGEAATQVAPPTVQMSDHFDKRQTMVRTRSVWPTVIATAAMLMLGVLGLQQAGVLSVQFDQGQQVADNPPPLPAHSPVVQPPVAATGWGWDRPGALPTDGPADAYLTKLAHSADEWFSKRPVDAEGVKQRITQFRDGCSTLITASHEPLAAEDREWLVEKCTAWRDKLDAQLAALESGSDPLEVRAAADETITKLMTAMRARAEKVA